MPEESKIQPERSVRLDAEDFAHGVQIERPAVSSKAHHFVFVAVMKKAQVLGQGRVKDAERVGEVDALIDSDTRFHPESPCCTRKISESVDRHACGFVKRRYQKCRRQMCLVVFHMVNVCPHVFLGKSSPQPAVGSSSVTNLSHLAKALHSESEIWPLRQEERQPV